MAGKHRKEKIERAPTKHQISKWKKQERLSRIIMICTVVVVVAIAGIIGYGIYSEQVLPYSKTILKVNNVSFNMDYYIKTMDILTTQATTDMLQYYVDTTATAIAQSEVLKEKAAAENLTASDDEINKAFTQMNVPNSDAAMDMARARVYTTEYYQQQCLPKQPQTAEQVEVEAMFLETKTMALDRQQKLSSGMGDNFTQTASKLSIDPTTQGSKGYVGWIAKDYESYGLGNLKDASFKDVIFTLEPGKLSDPIYDDNISKPFGYWILQVIEKDDTKGYHVNGMLLPASDLADDIHTRLLNGESWAALAKQYSQDASKDNGGDMGWIAPAQTSNHGMLDRILPTLAAGKISDVIRDTTISTKGGYWLVEVLNKSADRPLDDTVRQALAGDCLNAWMQGLMSDAKIENLLDQTQKDFAVAKITKERGK
ncbi:MAG: peptidylprolyl isomerase [Dehalococcoidia bacterium]